MAVAPDEFDIDSLADSLITDLMEFKRQLEAGTYVPPTPIGSSPLDKLVAEKVMGWHQELHGWGMMAWRDLTGHWSHEVERWSPTKSFSDANEVWDHVTRNSGLLSLFVDDEDGSMFVGAVICGQVIEIEPVSRESVELAMCHAALRFCGVSQEAIVDGSRT